MKSQNVKLKITPSEDGSDLFFSLDFNFLTKIEVQYSPEKVLMGDIWNELPTENNSLR